MEKRIVIIGCGNIGSRHLQALTQFPIPIEVDVVEPSKQAQQIALQRLKEMRYDEKTHKILWHKHLNELKGTFDLTIVATISTGRVALIKKLLRLGHSRFLIEKIVCQSTHEYDTLLDNMKKFKAKGWVNTTPRHFAAYKKIKNYFSKSKIIHMSLTTTGHYGLGTNAIHYLDLFSWFTNDYKITLNGSSLHNKLFSNKRGKSLTEFAGSITGTVSGGSSIILTFIPEANLPLLVNIYGNDNRHLIIDETNEHVFNTIGKNLHFDYVYEHTSNLTTKIANDILTKDDCQLSTLDNSYYLHKELFRILCRHMEKLTHKKTTVCPIT